MCDGDDVRAFIDEFKPDPSDPSPVEDVTIVMDKQTGMSKRFGFVRFITLEHARGKRWSLLCVAFCRDANLIVKTCR